jgi:hypothetical protein
MGGDMRATLMVSIRRFSDFEKELTGKMNILIYDNGTDD